MEQDILRAIVEVEREVQELLADEERLSDERLARVRQAENAEIATVEAGLQEELAVSTAAGGTEALKVGEALVTAATARARRLERLDDERLRQLLQGELSRLLPGMRP